MKKMLNLFLLAMVLGFNAPAYAYPTLQLDVSDGKYVAGTDETTYATADQFTLYSLLNNVKGDANTDAEYHIFASLQGGSSSDFGSFTFAGQKYDSTAGFKTGDPIGAEARSVYGNNTYYLDYTFKFDPNNKANAFDVQPKNGDIPGQVVMSPSGGFFYSAFQVDTSFLKNGYYLNFDLYGDGKNAPYSHDAKSISKHGTITDPSATPEPATMILLGIGLLGIAGFGRKAGKL